MPIMQSRFVWNRRYEDFHRLSNQAFDRLRKTEQAALLWDEPILEQEAEERNPPMELEVLLAYLRSKKQRTRLPSRFKRKKPKEALESFFMAYTDISIAEITEQLQYYLPPAKEEKAATASEEKTNYIYHLKMSWFIFYSAGLLSFEVLGGMAGIFELCKYLCESFHWAFIPPAVFAASVIFGLVEASVAAVFDVAAVAEKLNIPYLTACKELQSLLRQATELEAINQTIRTAILHLNRNTPITLEQKRASLEKHRELEQLLIRTLHNQQYVCDKITQFETAFKKSAKKRLALKVLWTLCAAPLYAAGANMSAVYVVGSAAAMGLPTIIAPIGLMIALAWIAWELYRFSSLEYANMASGVDALLGTPCDQMHHATTLKKTLEAETKKNFQDIHQRIKNLEHDIKIEEKSVESIKLEKEKAEKIAVINKYHLLMHTKKAPPKPTTTCALLPA
ncbi:MAG: hypothetical protein A3F10_02155 [Coxiella sp. RIFCSPHIGHO2_12_FULL_42_15]|nr:MAG: hypothetical protein A3F10_02155 [Coxiella sp. RIFCSPHIGHO2_12_FULL_42_15]